MLKWWRTNPDQVETNKSGRGSITITYLSALFGAFIADHYCRLLGLGNDIDPPKRGIAPRMRATMRDSRFVK